MEFIFVLSKVLMMMVLLLLMVAFLSLFERKFLGLSQNRKGPNVVGQFGILQPFSDAMKLITKIDVSPEKSSSVSFFIPPIIFFFSSLSLWATIPVTFIPTNFQTSGLFLIFWLSIGVYSLIFSGWFSYSKYSTLGLCRAIAQSISYEIILTFSLFSLYLSLGNVNLSKLIVYSKTSGLFLFFFLMIFFLISLLGESNRIPFDLPESESELVGGYSVEYGSVSYTILFLGENLSLLFCAFLLVIFVYGSSFFLIKFCLNLILLIWIRSTLPRVRFDKMMNLCWIELIPALLGMIVLLVFLC